MPRYFHAARLVIAAASAYLTCPDQFVSDTRIDTEDNR